MKAYITPIENSCNAHCTFCITRSKKETKFGHILDIADLEKLEKLTNIDCFEISGGGEPLLHPQINQILAWCTQRKPTILYTNGSLIKHLDLKTVQKLRKLTISQHHYSPTGRQLVMGVPLDSQTLTQFITAGVKVRFTLVLVKNGIGTVAELEKYLDWARSLGVQEVQVRQLFDFDYGQKIQDNFVATKKVLSDLCTLHHLPVKKGKYQTFNWKGLSVEFEGAKCACTDGVPNLRANGLLYQGWTDTLLPQTFYRL
jgi:MoaA/NifB/PqqE/SkfB family radical SAM enzyme